MVPVSEQWKDIHQRFLLPETHIEIDCSITDKESQENSTVFGTRESFFSNTASVLYDTTKTTKYATNELNLWALDGSRTIVPDNAPYADIGYVGGGTEGGTVMVVLPEVKKTPLAGVTITWGGMYDEYPSEFTVTAKNGDVVVAETTITENTSQVSVVFGEINNYDRILIVPHNWCLPNRRSRVEKVVLGNVLTFTKKDILSFTHEQSGHLNSGELPKNSITFSLDNTDGLWNPNNQNGLSKYLSERQKIKVRYGLDVGGSIEWINAGTFYLSEWKVPSNGLEANFVARDVFEYLLNEPYTGSKKGNTFFVIQDALSGLPEGASVFIVPQTDKYVEIPDGEYTCAEILQLCANATKSVMYCDCAGVFQIRSLPKINTEYVIPLSLSYSHPEIELSKQLKNVSVTYKDGTFVLPVGNSGDTQTVNNQLLASEESARDVAVWVRDTLSTRKTLRGEYRADPRLELFDVVVVQSKYGDISNVVITNIKYTFSGSFQGNYVGRVLEVI